MGEYAAWAREVAAELVAAGLRVNPEPPPTNTFEVFADAPLDGHPAAAGDAHGAREGAAVRRVAGHRRISRC